MSSVMPAFTIKTALVEASARLAAAGIPRAQSEAALLLSAVLHTNRAFLISAENNPLKKPDCRRFFSLIERRTQGDCAAYLTQCRSFRHLDLYVDKRVLVPRPETETLVEAALSWVDEQGVQTALDVGTGSGAIALALLDERPFLKLCAADISRGALAVAKKNYRALLARYPAKHFCYAPSFVVSDLFNKLRRHQQFDMIVSNPPYVPSAAIKTLAAEVQREPRRALDGGEDGLVIIQKIIEEAPRFLKHGGALFLEADPRQMGVITRLLEEHHYRGIVLHADLAGDERVIQAQMGGLHPFERHRRFYGVFTPLSGTAAFTTCALGR